ncbi:MAG: energy transducer TonB, partial [Bryobacteraceae bacterium]
PDPNAPLRAQATSYVAKKSREKSGKHATPWLVASLGLVAAFGAVVWHFDGDALGELIGVNTVQPDGSAESAPLKQVNPPASTFWAASLESHAPTPPATPAPEKSEAASADPEEIHAKRLDATGAHSHRRSLRMLTAASKPVVPKRALPQAEPPAISGSLTAELTPQIGNSKLPPAPVVLPSFTYDAPVRSTYVPRTTQTVPAQVIEQRPPVYPQAARAAGLTGTVELHVAIAADGKVQHIQVVRGNDLLANAAIEAVKRWRYQAARRGGMPYASETNLIFIFK